MYVKFKFVRGYCTKPGCGERVNAGRQVRYYHQIDCWKTNKRKFPCEYICCNTDKLSNDDHSDPNDTGTFIILRGGVDGKVEVAVRNKVTGGATKRGVFVCLENDLTQDGPPEKKGKFESGKEQKSSSSLCFSPPLSASSSSRGRKRPRSASPPPSLLSSSSKPVDINDFCGKFEKDFRQLAEYLQEDSKQELQAQLKANEDL
eukprot:CAMPEP_0175175718 /NCGR_PEP_ID=MMETSP0087-20121206/33364_1 /TAXON_ID=136419 /ORGANISM="Unknown Unknown, Strain D1" /LENGTH=202 /DNA_ID=CAMNT_0016467371 /DNA_START=104 /DNA_END=708 /DNA_ORIENTATION=+